MNTLREDAVYLSKLAEQAERYEEMTDAIKKVTQLHLELTIEERNLFSVAYKNIIGERRAAYRILTSILEKERSRGSSRIPSIMTYLSKIKGEMEVIHDEVIFIIDNNLLPFSSNPESQVFYNKMKGDYHRYKFEFSDNSNEKANAARIAFYSYNHANNISHAQLHPCNPIRLGLALNFSVFYYEILNDPRKACEINIQAFDDAIGRLDELSEENYKDSTVMMQLLRDGGHLTLWSAEQDGEEDEEGEYHRTTS